LAVSFGGVQPVFKDTQQHAKVVDETYGEASPLVRDALSMFIPDRNGGGKEEVTDGKNESPVICALPRDGRGVSHRDLSIVVSIGENLFETDPVVDKYLGQLWGGESVWGELALGM